MLVIYLVKSLIKRDEFNHLIYTLCYKICKRTGSYTRSLGKENSNLRQTMALSPVEAK
jgi:hypothetical protein